MSDLKKNMCRLIMTWRLWWSQNMSWNNSSIRNCTFDYYYFLDIKHLRVKLTVVSLVREVPLVFVEVAEKAASEVQPFAFWKRQNVLFLLFLIKFHVSRSAPGSSMNRNKLSKKFLMTSTKIFTRLCSGWRH